MKILKSKKYKRKWTMKPGEELLIKATNNIEIIVITKIIKKI